MKEKIVARRTSFELFLELTARVQALSMIRDFKVQLLVYFVAIIVDVLFCFTPVSLGSVNKI